MPDQNQLPIPKQVGHQEELYTAVHPGQSNAFMFLNPDLPTESSGYCVLQVLAFQRSWRSFSPIIVCILAHCMLPF